MMPNSYAASREWRGKIAVGPDMVHQRLSDLMQGGAAFVVEPVPAAGAAALAAEPGWPVALVGTDGAFTVFSPDDDDHASAGDLVMRLYQPTLASAPIVRRRRFGLRRSRALA